MLSILIPIYNYNAYLLVSELHKQCELCKKKYEIICFDDASFLFNAENKQIDNLSNCEYSLLEKNIGRSGIRNLLAEKAKNNWLLFLDSDVIPTQSNFISNYLEIINLNYDLILGGYKYESTVPKSAQILRYKYGKSREEKIAVERNKNPYNLILSGNLLIKKELFQTSNYTAINSSYGMDNYLAFQLFIKKVPVLHIENPVFHLGLETNEKFFNKSLESVRNRKNIMMELEGIDQINSLIKQYNFLKKMKLITITKIIFRVGKNILEKNILGKNPNLLIFDIYRLGYLCNLKD